MPLPNLTIDTATALAGFPDTVTEDTHDSGTTQIVWFKFTATGTGIAGIFAFGNLTDYTANITVYIGPTNAPTLYLGGLNASNVPIQFPTKTGTTYYMQVAPSLFQNASPSTLTLTATWAPNDPVPIGSLFVPDDASGFPASALSIATGTPLQFIIAFPSGESGDVIPSTGTMMLSDNTNRNVVVYTPLLATVATLPYIGTIQADPSITHGASGKFYFGEISATNTAIVKRITALGAIDTTWTLTATQFIDAIAPNAAETHLYLSGKSGASDSTVFVWDLIGSAYLANFAADVSGYQAPADILSLTDGSVVVSYEKITTTRDLTVKVYDSAGTVIVSKSYGSAWNPGARARMAYAIDNPNSFWLWLHNSNGTSTFKNVKTSDLSDLASITIADFENGVNQTAPTASPTNFGHSFSCPFLVLRNGVGGGIALPRSPGQPNPAPPHTTTTYPVRRLRQTAHLSDEQLWLFFSKFQLDCETGIGLNDGQGSDPQVMLSWSDDGGHTWSAEQWVSAGKQGEYKRRAIWRILGRSRDRVWRIVVSDPVAWRLLAAYIDVTKGTS